MTPDSSECGEDLRLQSLSPEFITAITERVKSDVIQHFTQTANVEGQQKSPEISEALVVKKESALPVNSVTFHSLRGPPQASPPKHFAHRFFEDLSATDKEWGKLFYDKGYHTPRLDEILEGLANYIIDEFSPKKSMQVTPSKMVTYYSNYMVKCEANPLVLIFQTAHPLHISSLYRILGCEHDFTGLTPAGFARWMTLQILAYPEIETERLQMIVKDLPIKVNKVTTDGKPVRKPEYLPRQISSRLFPYKEDLVSKMLVTNAIQGLFRHSLQKDQSRGTPTISPMPLPSTTPVKKFTGL